MPVGKGRTTELTIVDHLTELRWRLLACMLSVFIGIGVGFIYAGRILDVILAVPGDLVYLAPAEAFYTHVRVSVLAGILFSFPMIL